MANEAQSAFHYETQIAPRLAGSLDDPLSGVDRWAAVAAVATRQHGVIGLEQLVALGAPPATVRTWVARGRLFPVRRGVYAVGHTSLTRESRRMAATLSVSGSVLRCRTAASALGFRQTAIARIELAAPRRARGPGLDIRVATLDAADVSEVDSIPCTTVARTIVDLASMLDDSGLAKSIDDADAMGLFDLGAVKEASNRAGPRHRGRVRLNRVLGSFADPDLTETEIERLMLAHIRSRGWPEPEIQARLVIEGREYRPDFLWRSIGLAVETDGLERHGTRAAMRRDRRRDQILKTAGIDTLRFTWDQVSERTWELDAVLSPLLARAAGQAFAAA